jgi:ATP-dependent DNA ligase
MPLNLDASVLPGAKPAPFPGFVEPCHPTLREEAPSGERWVDEIKFDGYRMQAHLRKRTRPTISTRRGHDWTRRFHDRRCAGGPPGGGPDPGRRRKCGIDGEET